MLDIIDVHAGTVIGGWVDSRRAQRLFDMSRAKFGMSARCLPKKNAGGIESSPRIATFAIAPPRGLYYIAGADSTMLHRREETTECAQAVGAALLASLLLATPADAYIGPGAGFAFVGSFFMLLWALVLGAFTLASYPLRLIWRALRRRSIPASAPRRVVIIGFDGMDPALAERWMAEGKLPSLAALARDGAFRRLQTTHPPLSPVAWSSFMTGVHPARHGIFDFLARDARSYLPFLSSSTVESAKRSLAIGKFQVPLGRPRLRLFRKAPAVLEDPRRARRVLVGGARAGDVSRRALPRRVSLGNERARPARDARELHVLLRRGRTRERRRAGCA